jgi:hypothetical protein
MSPKIHIHHKNCNCQFLKKDFATFSKLVKSVTVELWTLCVTFRHQFPKHVPRPSPSYSITISALTQCRFHIPFSHMCLKKFTNFMWCIWIQSFYWLWFHISFLFWKF